MATLSHGVEADNVLSVDGLMPERRGGAVAVARKAVTTAGRADPFPQALDGEPDHLVASLRQVAADSKPKLAEMVGVALPSSMPSAGQGGRPF